MAHATGNQCTHSRPDSEKGLVALPGRF
jgi:hypothetical protein